MFKRFCAGLGFFMLFIFAHSQSPQSISFQAIARDAGNNLYVSVPVNITTHIRKGTPLGPSVCTEAFNPVSNDYGAVGLEIGTVDPVAFAAIDWSDGPYFLEVIVAGVSTGTTQLMSVPYALYANQTENYNETDPVFSAHPAFGITLTNISNWTTAYGWGDHAGLYKPNAYLPAFSDITGKPTTLAGYGITDAMNTSHPANAIAGGDITNWNTAFGWGNHAGLYRPIAWVPSWANVSGKPTTLAGYGITDAMNTSHPANAIAAGDITNWNTAFGWGDHDGLYRPLAWVPAWDDVTGKPSFAAVATSGSYNDLTGRLTGNNFGDMIYWDGAAWQLVPVGGVYQHLRVNLSSIPEWTGPTLPGVITTDPYDIGPFYGKSGGTITNDGGLPIIARGICWSTSPEPTLADRRTFNGSGQGIYVSVLTDLQINTTYHIRAYATNALGTAYGNEVMITTTLPCEGINNVSDVNGNNYTTIQIANQCWFEQNLKATSYSNGDPILDGNGIGNINGWVEPKYYFAYNDNEANVPTYGRLYTYWVAADPRNVCPTGWHTAGIYEYDELITNIGGYSVGGGRMKEIGTTHWLSPNTAATNSSGFTGLPGGERSYLGSFSRINQEARFWTSTYNTLFMGIHMTYFVTLKYDFESVTYFLGQDANHGLSIRCIKDRIPIVSTNTVSGITSTSANTGGNVRATGGLDVTERGVCYSTNPNPTIDDNRTSNGSGVGAFTSSIIGLQPETTYYVRAYASNSLGTGYGPQRTFTTPPPPVIDQDGNSYPVTNINGTYWMAGNLIATTYSNGDPIPNLTDNLDWLGAPGGAWCHFDNNPANEAGYGKLYNWQAVTDPRGLCPVGWHVPTDAEFTAMTDFYGGLATAGGPLKQTGTVYWNAPNTGATNSSGWSARGGGYRTGSGDYFNLMSEGYFWSSTPGAGATAWFRSLNSSGTIVNRSSTNIEYGMSVRCVKD